MKPLSRELFDSELETVGACPYCGGSVSIEPTDMCCGGVHGVEAYLHEDLTELILEDDLDSAFREWQKIKLKGESSND